MWSLSLCYPVAFSNAPSPALSAEACVGAGDFPVLFMCATRSAGALIECAENPSVELWPAPGYELLHSRF